MRVPPPAAMPHPKQPMYYRASACFDDIIFNHFAHDRCAGGVIAGIIFATSILYRASYRQGVEPAPQATMPATAGIDRPASEWRSMLLPLRVAECPDAIDIIALSGYLSARSPRRRLHRRPSAQFYGREASIPFHEAAEATPEAF